MSLIFAVSLIITAISLNLYTQSHAKIQVIPKVLGTTSLVWSSNVMAWIYPGSPGCSAPNEFMDGRYIDTLKPEYFSLQSNGVLSEETVSNSGCNGYSAQNAAQIKAYSQHQYITVSGESDGLHSLVSSQQKMTNAITTMISLVQQTGFSGIEIDFENVDAWSASDYTGYKTFLAQLGNALHADNEKLMIDLPLDASTDNSSPVHFSDFNTLPVDYILLMEYDDQDNNGVGTPVAPLSWMQLITASIINQISDINRIVIGIPSYGYHGTLGNYTATEDTYTQSSTYPNFSSAIRDSSSAEMFFSNGSTFYDYSDSTSLNTKRETIESMGIKYISVWSLGGNLWFSGKLEPGQVSVTATPTPAQTPTLTPTPTSTLVPYTPTAVTQTAASTPILSATAIPLTTTPASSHQVSIVHHTPSQNQILVVSQEGNPISDGTVHIGPITLHTNKNGVIHIPHNKGTGLSAVLSSITVFGEKISINTNISSNKGYTIKVDPNAGKLLGVTIFGYSRSIPDHPSPVLASVLLVSILVLIGLCMFTYKRFSAHVFAYVMERTFRHSHNT